MLFGKLASYLRAWLTLVGLDANLSAGVMFVKSSDMIFEFG